MVEITDSSPSSGVVLRVRDDVDREPMYELIPAERIGDNTYRLLRSPGLVEGVAAGDKIEVDERTKRFNILRRAGNVCAWIFFDGNIDEPAANELRAQIERVGGSLDGGTHSSLIFTLPSAAGFPAIEEIFKHFEETYPATTWMFSNVYDAVDGVTPLNWWMNERT